MKKGLAMLVLALAAGAGSAQVRSDAPAPVSRARRAGPETARDASCRHIQEGLCNMIVDDGQDDRLLAVVASLRTYDASYRHARQLRRRCHAMLQTKRRSKRSVSMVDSRSVRRVIVPALGGTWCLLYLFEIVRFAAAI